MVEALRLSRPQTYLDLLAQKQRRDHLTLAGGDPKLDSRRPQGLDLPPDHVSHRRRGAEPVRSLHDQHATHMKPESWEEAESRGRRAEAEW